MGTQQNNQVMPFDFKGHTIRTLFVDDEPWFVASDVCDVLGIGNARDAVMNLDEDEKSNVGNTDIRNIELPNRGVNVVNESGLYHLVFKSRKPEAKQFRKWVTQEVLPELRKTGTYTIGQKSAQTPHPENDGVLLLSQAVLYANRKLEEQKALLEKQNALIEEKNARIDSAIALIETQHEINAEMSEHVKKLEPKAEYFDILVARGALTNLRVTADEIQFPLRKLTRFLLEEGFIYYVDKNDKKKGLLPYSEYVTGDPNKRYFEVKDFYNKKNQHYGKQTLITPLGKQYFAKAVKEWAKQEAEQAIQHYLAEYPILDSAVARSAGNRVSAFDKLGKDYE